VGEIEERTPAVPPRAALRHVSVSELQQRPGDATMLALIEAMVDLRFQRFLEDLPDTMLGMDREGGVRFANLAAETLFGRPRHDLLGMRVEGLLTEPDAQESGSWFGALVEGSRRGLGETREMRALRVGAGPVLVGVTLSLVGADNPEGLWMVAAIRDMSATSAAAAALRASEDRYRQILETASDAYIAVDPSGVVLEWNRQAEQVFGWSPGEAIGRNLLGFAIPQSWGGALALLLAADPGGDAPSGSQRMELAGRRRDGEEFPVEITAWWSRGPVGGQVNVFVQDVTERRRAAEDLAAAYAQAERRAVELQARNREILLLSDMGELLQSCVSTDEVYEVFAEFGERLFPGVSGAVFLPAGKGNVWQAVTTWGEEQASARAFATEDCWALRRGRPHIAGPAQPGPQCRHIEGRRADTACLPMMAQGQAIGVLHVAQLRGADLKAQPRWESVARLAPTVAEHVALSLANFQLRQSLRIQSVRDPLTGLFNRRYLDESLDRELARAARTHRALAVVMLDVDHFKEYNDAFGHATGDAVLGALGSLLHDELRGGDIACRFGGEEFTLVLPEATLEDAVRKAHLLREAARALKIPPASRSITLSLGVAEFPEDGETAPSLLRAADLALYAAKEAGRDCVMTARRRAEPGTGSVGAPRRMGPIDDSRTDDQGERP